MGLPVILGDETTPMSAYVQVPGTTLRLQVDVLRLALQRSTGMRSVMLHYAHAFFDQVPQSAACNHFHSLDQRCCRWLLMTGTGRSIPADAGISRDNAGRTAKCHGAKASTSPPAIASGGILNAPATGEALAELIADGTSRSTDLTPFDPVRLRPLHPALQQFS